MFLWLFPRNALILCLLGYRRWISPLYGDVCRYYPSCSRYALEAIQAEGAVRGCLMGVWRILRCNPWSAGGVDDVIGARSGCFEISTRGFVIFQRSSPVAAVTGQPTEYPVLPVMAPCHRKG